MKFIITFVILVYSFQPAIAQGDHISFTPQNEKAVRDLIKRVLPKHADYFIVRFMPKEAKDYFEIESSGGKIILSGATGVYRQCFALLPKELCQLPDNME